MTALELLVLALAAWRLAFMLVLERGPFDLFARLRARWPLGGLLTCVYCASVWTAALLLLLWPTPLRFIAVVLAVSAAGLMLAAFSGAAFNGGET